CQTDPARSARGGPRRRQSTRIEAGGWPRTAGSPGRPDSSSDCRLRAVHSRHIVESRGRRRLRSRAPTVSPPRRNEPPRSGQEWLRHSAPDRPRPRTRRRERERERGLRPSPAILRTSALRRSSSPAAAADEPWIEASIPQLQALMTSGQLSSRELTLGYLGRIATLNPLLGAVIQTNPNAVSIAARLDNERRAGKLRGPLHGIPVLLKDNISTDDQLQTTAGSLALVESRVPADAPIVARLRDAGAVILGKANLSEWANFRGFAPFNGWSARGGFTREPYLLSFDPCGSSSGSAVAPAANLCAAAVGTETDGSVVCPSGNNLVFGLKPTVGLVSQDGIIPIAHSQDTAGPMCRSVTDVAIMLGVMQSPFGSVR